MSAAWAAQSFSFWNAPGEMCIRDSLDDALCLVAGQLQMVLQGVCRAVPVASQSRIQNFQMLQMCIRDR